jgi:hypothetical protein
MPSLHATCATLHGTTHHRPIIRVSGVTLRALHCSNPPLSRPRARPEGFRRALRNRVPHGIVRWAPEVSLGPAERHLRAACRRSARTPCHDRMLTGRVSSRVECHRRIDPPLLLGVDVWSRVSGGERERERERERIEQWHERRERQRDTAGVARVQCSGSQA